MTRTFRTGRCHDGYVTHGIAGDWTALAEWVAAELGECELRDTQWNDADGVILSQVRAHWIFGDESDLYFVINDEREDEAGRYSPRRGEWVLKLGYVKSL